MKKKLLLVGVAAMGLLAVGVGATSTFAWYKATAAVHVDTITPTSSSITVGESEYALGDITANVLKADVSADVSGLGLAHYKSSITKDTAKKLSTGYIDNGGTFHDAPETGSGDNVEPDLAGWSWTKLYTTLTIQIKIDSTKFIDKDNATPGTYVAADATPASDDYIEIGGVNYTYSFIETEVRKNKVDILIKPSSSSRVRLMTTVAAENDPAIAIAGVAGTSSGESPTLDSNGYYLLDDAKQLSSISTSTAVSSTSIYAYVFGGATGTPVDDSAEDSVSGTVDIKVAFDSYAAS